MLLINTQAANNTAKAIMEKLSSFGVKPLPLESHQRRGKLEDRFGRAAGTLLGIAADRLDKILVKLFGRLVYYKYI